MIYSSNLVKGSTEVFSNKGVTSLLILSIEIKLIKYHAIKLEYS